MAQPVRCKYCLREYPSHREGSACDGCGAALPEALGTQAPPVQPGSSGKNKALGYGIVVTLALLLVIAGMSAFSFVRGTLTTQVVAEAVEEQIQAIESIETEEPEPEPTQPAPGERLERELDDDMLFFFRIYLEEMGFLLDVLERLENGELDMELEEFYVWLEQEDVLLSQYDEIVERLEREGYELDSYSQLMDSFGELEDIWNFDFSDALSFDWEMWGE